MLWLYFQCSPFLTGIFIHSAFNIGYPIRPSLCNYSSYWGNQSSFSASFKKKAELEKYCINSKILILKFLICSILKIWYSFHLKQWTVWITILSYLQMKNHFIIITEHVQVTSDTKDKSYGIRQCNENYILDIMTFSKWNFYHKSEQRLAWLIRNYSGTIQSIQAKAQSSRTDLEKHLWSKQSVDCREDGHMFEMKWVFCCIRHIVHRMESERCCWEIGQAVWDQDLCLYSPNARYFKLNSYSDWHNLETAHYVCITIFWYDRTTA